MKNIEHLLQQSLTQYQGVLDYLQSLSNNFSKLQSAREIESCCTTLRSMLADAQRTDTSINTFLEKGGIDTCLATVLHERQQLMGEVIKQNKLLFPRITGKLAVISSEISQLKTGKTVMSNYKAGQGETGNFIKTSL